MTMNSKNLSVLAYANGFTLWHYRTEDSKATVLANGYFNAVANIFNVGDVIISSVDIDGQRETVMLVVKESPVSGSGNVVISTLNN